MTTRNGTALAEQPALIKMTRTEAYQRVRSAAAQEFANTRSTQIAERADFERHYGSTAELDQGFVNDMRALMLRASAISLGAGSKRSTYDSTVVPNKTLERVASSLASAVGECELYLATRKARSMFAPPAEEDFLAKTYGGKVGDPYSWVGDRARHVVDAVLAGVTIVDDEKITSVHELEKAAVKHCVHELVDGYVDEMPGDEDPDPTDEETGGRFKKCAKGCGYGGLELTLHGETIVVPQASRYALDLESLCRDGVMYLPDGITLEQYEKLSKKKKSEIAAKIGEMLDEKAVMA